MRCPGQGLARRSSLIITKCHARNDQLVDRLRRRAQPSGVQLTKRPLRLLDAADQQRSAIEVLVAMRDGDGR